jgi:predicted Rossmann-fold nucleotide-binding protein
MIVGVMASGKKPEDEEKRLAREVGNAIAELGYHLLTGGGGGSMEAVGQAFLNTKQRAGKLISILRAKDTTHLTSEWNDQGELDKLRTTRETKRNWKPRRDNNLGEMVIRTHLPYSGKLGLHDLSRNHINALTSDLIVVLPGEKGTYSELELAWQYDRDIMLYLGKNGTVDGQTPKQLKAKFDKIAVGDNEIQLKQWLKTTKPCA